MNTKKNWLLLVICLTWTSCADKNEITVNQVPMQWRYDVPATKYWEGLPIGTGRFAALRDFLSYTNNLIRHILLFIHKNNLLSFLSL
jgi:hypothetical protein